MAPIPIKRVVSVSSEDAQNPATNLLRGGSGRKWLTGAGETLQRAEVVLELGKKARISRLEISNFGAAFIEVHVSSGSAAVSPHGSGEWLTLLPSCMLMTVADSRAGRNKTSALVCSRERFSATAVDTKWCLVKVICRQPYNLSSQFGLQHVAFFATSHTLPPSPSSLSPSPRAHIHSSPTSHTLTNTPDQIHKLPSLPTSTMTPSKPGVPNSSSWNPTNKKSTTTKRPLAESNNLEEECEEFCGVESQSRLLRNALKTPKNEVAGEPNPILARVREKAEMKSFEGSYEKRRLLVGELTKAKGKTDFLSEYEKSSSSVEMTAALRKISRHDNKCEIGQEHPPWLSSRRRGKRVKEGGEDLEAVWVTRRRKKLSGMIRDCRRVLSEAGTAGGTSGCPEELPLSPDADSSPLKGSANSPCTSQTLDDTQPLALSLPLNSPSDNDTPPTLPCPLCGQSFPVYAIELHAASCGENTCTTPLFVD